MSRRMVRRSSWLSWLKCARSLASALLLSCAVAIPATGADRLWLELEGAAAWQTRNDFAVPGETGTRVGLDRTGDGPVAGGRATLVLGLGEHWAVRLLVAPLRVETDFVPASPVDFQDATFAAGVPVQNEYVFNSYRVSFFRRLGARKQYRLGLTAKVRQAKIALYSGSVKREETDLGFVPLLYGGARFALATSGALDLEVDAAGAPQGYAIDASARYLHSVGRRVQLFAGYRILDGGADVESVYAFATFHYATAGIVVRM